MKFFTDIFNRKKEDFDENSVNETTSITERKEEKCLEDKTVDETHEKAKKLVFNSDKEIENYYVNQKKKAKNYVRKLEIKKLFLMIQVAEKELFNVSKKKDELEKAITELNDFLEKSNMKMNEFKKKKKNEVENISMIVNLEKNIRQLNSEVLSMIETKEKLISEEKKIMEKLDLKVSGSIDRIKQSDEAGALKLKETENQKDYVLQEFKDLVTEEKMKVNSDINLLEGINKNVYENIKKFNSQLKLLKKDRISILKKKHLTEISRDDAIKQMHIVEKKIEKLKQEYDHLVK